MLSFVGSPFPLHLIHRLQSVSGSHHWIQVDWHLEYISRKYHTCARIYLNRVDLLDLFTGSSSMFFQVAN